jgi:hypothetical protein
MSFFRDKEIQTLLQQALKFTGDDLQANRLNRLSEGQIATLKAERFWAMFIIGTIGVVIAAFILFSSAPLVIAFIPAAIALAICAIVHFTTEAVLQHGKVESVTGIVRRSMSVSADISKKHVHISTNYQILIGDKSFSVAKNVHDAFVESEVYTLYYIQNNRILSGEMTNPSEGFEQRKAHQTEL